MKKNTAFIVAALTMAATACTPWSNVKPTEWTASADREGGQACAIAAAKTMMVQIRNLNIEDVRLQDPDVVAIDFQSGGGECGDLTAGEVKALRERPEDPRGNRVVLAYMNIGRAEHYRLVWQPDGPDGKCQKSVMMRVDTSLDDESPIDFTNAGWKETLAGAEGSYVARIVSLGFDGVLLDGIGAVRDEGWNVRAESAAAMSDLVKAIAGTGRALNPGFAVVVGDAVALAGVDGALAGMTAVFSKNVLMYNGYVRPEAELKPMLDDLNALKAQGLPVLSAEYVEDPFQQTHYQNICMKMGYLCFITVEALNAPGLLVEAGNRGSCPAR